MDDKLPKNTPVNPKIIQEQLRGIKNDLSSENEHVRSAAGSTLDALLLLSKAEVDREVVRMIADPANTGTSSVQKSIIKAYKQRLTSAALKGREFIECLSEWKDCNTQKLMDMLESIFVKNVPKETCKTLLLKDCLPVMFSTNTSNDIRDVLIEVSSLLAVIIPISTLTSTESESFLENMSQKYVASVEKLRDQDNKNWDKLLIFLIKYCSVNLHNSIQLTNKVLRVVECAFKNPSIEQRIEGYACWKEIINNASQNLSYFHGRKQIKLLVTPLKANFCKQSIVICKRFELFVYLMEKLQEKAVLCLSDFLQFQFGALDGDNQNRKKIGQGKSVSQLLVPSTKVLIALIGHSHGKNGDCLSTEDTIRFKNTIVTHLNFQTFHKPIIQSIGECCVLLKDVNEDIDREKVVKCLWKSLFDLVLPALGENKTSYFNMTSHVFNVFLKHLNTDTYFQNLLKWVLSTFTLYEKKLVHELFKHLLDPILTSLSNTSNMTSEEIVAVKDIFSYTISKITHEEKLIMIRDVISIIVSPDYAVSNAFNIKYIWIGLVEELVTNLSVECIEKFEKYDEFFMWPLYNLHHLDEVRKKHVLLGWFKLYRKMLTDDAKKTTLLNNLKVAFKNNPLLVSNIISLLEVMTQYEVKTSKDYVMKLMKIIISISELPTLSGEDEQKVTNMLGQNLDLNVDLLKKEGSDGIIESIYQCIERLLTVRKNFNILETFATFLQKSPEVIRKKFASVISNFLQELLDKELVANSCNAKQIQKVLTLLDSKPKVKKIFMLPSGRSAKIAHLAKNFPKSPDKRKSESNLRLFGTDPETMSPIRVKGSQLNNTPYRRTIKPDCHISKKEVIEENSEDFVPIDTKVKFQPHKMPEHQKETMRKKREDIPALYQDLSQSNSQDLFGSNSNSNFGNGTKLPKVIVERIDTVYINPLSVEDDLTQIDEDLFKKIEQNTSNNLSTSPDKSDSANSKDLNGISEKKSKKKSPPKSAIVNIRAIPTSTEKVKEVTPEVISPTPQVSNDVKQDQFNTDRIQRKKLPSELSRLKMDIVGAENYTSTLRRTRSKNSEKRLSSLRKSPKKNKILNQNETPKTHRARSWNFLKRKKSLGNKTEQNSEKGASECKKKRKRSVDNDDDDIIESSQKPYDITPLNSPRRQTDTYSSTLVQQKTVIDKDFVEDSDVSSKKIVSETQPQNTIAETQTQNDLPETTEEPALNTTQDTTATQESDTSVSHEVLKGPNVLTQCSDRTQSQDTITQPTQDSAVESQEAKAPTLYFDLPKKPVTLTDSEQFQCGMDTMSIVGSNYLKELFVKEEIASTADNSGAEDPYQSIPSSPVTPDTPSKTSMLLSNTIDISPINSDDSNDDVKQEIVSSQNSQNQFSTLDLKFSGEEQIPAERSHNEENQEKATSPQKSRSGTMNVRSSKLLNMIHLSSPTMRRIKRRSGNSSLSPSSGSVLKYMYNGVMRNSPSREDEDYLTFSREIPSPLAVPRSSILKRKLCDVGDGDGMSPCAKRKRVNFSDPCLTSKKLFIKDDVENEIENDEIEIVEVETEPSEEIIPAPFIRKNKPFYPQLIDCDDDISHITQKMTTPPFFKSLITQFQLDGIKTIGDLAQLSETEIKGFPFKPPPLKTVHNILERYWKLKHLNKGNKLSNSDDKKKEVEENLKQLMQKAAAADLPSEHLAKTLLANLDESQLFSIFRTFNFPLERLLAGQDMETVAGWVLSQFDTCKIIELLNDICGSVSARKTLLSKFSLTEILAEKNVTELKASIIELVTNDTVKRDEVIENCLIPLIRTPKDIFGYLNRLSVVDLEDVVLERFHSDDLDRFLQKLSEKFENHSLAVKVLKPSNDITKVFKSCLASQVGENQEKIMIEMYRFIGEHLSLENLINLHVEFLKRIPNLYVKRNE